ncbi:MAG: T9SS type A sorting domain-containing protein [Saprospiraceae bacterium]|nr:T9SS type A sorting domain-containing protein [Saprospiraceae bacterium]
MPWPCSPTGKSSSGGGFTSYNGTPRNFIARLNADGSLDTGFNPGTGASSGVYAMALQPDGKILIGGFFNSYNGTGRNRIARLNADGSLDTGFNPGTGANDWVQSLALQPDGKILIGGGFTSYNGTGRNRVARLNADGSLDTGFNPGTGANGWVWAMALQPDGKILIGGLFTTYNGTGRNYIARLNADGSLDTGFNPGTGAGSTVWAMALQPDGKILIGGDFTTYNGTGRNRVARLNADGSLDTGFNPGTGANNVVRAMSLQPDGKILIGGAFTGYDGTGRNRVARVNGGSSCVEQTWYIDADGDGYGDAAVSVMACSAPTNYVSNNTDCNDGDDSVHEPQLYYVDADGDGYGSTTTAMLCSSTAPAGYATNNTDCNDGDDSVHEPQLYYVDADGDGYGSTTTAMLCSSTAPAGYATNNTDCNDSDDSVHEPQLYYVDGDGDGYGSTTTAMLCSSTAPVGYATNNTDCNDGDDSVHEPQLYYVDGDGDGYGSTTTAMLCSSTAPAGYAGNNTDCNDSDDSVHEPQLYYVDGDGDGYGSTTTAMLCSSTAPSGYATNNTDCNDNDDSVHEPQLYYVDADGDGYGSTTTAMLCSSTAPAGYATNNTDCNDNDDSVHEPQLYYVDADGDGYGSTTTAMLCSSTAPAGYATNNTDCNDNDDSVHEPQLYYVDADGDGYGSTTTAMLCSSTAPTGYATNNTDCNDNDDSVHEPQLYYVDADGDGYGSTTTAMLCSSTAPAGYATNNTDCNDGDAAINPAATEICDNVDNDCDGLMDTADPNYVDNILPTITCASQAMLNFNGEASIQIDGMNSPLNLQIVANDNCGIASTMISPGTISASQVGQSVPVTITVTDGKGNPATCITTVNVTGLPAGWSAAPDGVGCGSGNNIAYNTGTGVWTATSTNCYYASPFTADETAFAQRTLCGDGSITARVTSINGTALGWAGVVMRESNAAGAKKAQLMTNLSNLSRREFRTAANGAAIPQQIPSLNRYWLRIVRAGNEFTMYVSPNGTAWYFAGTQTIVMTNCIQMGLVVTNYTPNSTVTATFSNVSFTGSNSGLATGGSIEQSTQSIEAPHSFEVYPNPTGGELNIDLTQYAGRSVRIEVYSLEGKLLQFSEIDEVQTTVEQMNLSDYHSGMYLVKVKSAGLPDATRRVVKQ